MLNSLLLNLLFWVCACSADQPLDERFEDNDFGEFENNLDMSKLIAIPGKFVFKSDITAQYMYLNPQNRMVFNSSTASNTYFQHYYYGNSHYYQFASGPHSGNWLGYNIDRYLGAYSNFLDAKAFSSSGCLSLTSQPTWKTYRYSSTSGIDYVLIGNYNYPLVCFQTVEYEYFPVYDHYIGENYYCSWQPKWVQCPPYVTYDNADQSQSLAVTVFNGNLLQSERLFDTSGADIVHTGRRAIIVMDIFGNLFASNQFKRYMFHHSSILGGANVTFAGEISVRAGEILEVTTCNGHYRIPDSVGIISLQTSLVRLGYTRPVNVTPCSSFSSFYWDLDYNCVHESCKAEKSLMSDLNGI